MHPQYDPFPAQTQGARCARHPELAARAICSRCGSYACAQCHQRSVNGADFCVDCQARAPVLASRGARFMANLVDQLAVTLPVLIGTFTQIARDSSNPGSERDYTFMVLGVLVSFGLLGYQLVLLARSGQSIGKRMLRIRVLRTDGSPASFGRLLLLRNVVPGLINAGCGFFSLLDALFIYGEQRRCLHDLLADTQVVEVPRHQP